MKVFNPKVIASILTIAIITLLIVAGPAEAFALDMSISNDKPVEGETVTFNVSTSVETADNPSDVDSFTLFIIKTNAKDVVSCTFFPNGTKITACPGIDVTQTSSPTFGYGYGYGYGSGKFSYEIILNTTGLHPGAYRTSFVANVHGKELIKEGKKLVIHEGKEENENDNDENDDHNETENEKVEICHHPGKVAETIEVDEHALDEHLKHGDHLGVCTQEDIDQHQGNQTNNGKILMCHHPQNTAETIEVDLHSVEAHLGHGDHLGVCTEKDIAEHQGKEKDKHEDENDHDDKGKDKNKTNENNHENDDNHEDNNNSIDTNNQEEKVTICHHPGKVAETIEVSKKALAEHLAHGDHLGVCTEKDIAEHQGKEKDKHEEHHDEHHEENNQESGHDNDNNKRGKGKNR